MNRLVIIFIIIQSLWGLCSSVAAAPRQIEKMMIEQLEAHRTEAHPKDGRCHFGNEYIIYLIDNFDQPIRLIPEVTTTHGELIHKILISGRDDISVMALNTSLTKGLAMVLDDLARGECADAVISAIPGSNYTYSQIGSLIPDAPAVNRDNIMEYRERLLDLLEDIAFNGFPSVSWLEQVDVNSSKLMNDARMLTFARALGRYQVPILIPYGNRDAPYHDELRQVNLLSLAPKVSAFSALDRRGQRLSGFPYCPLSIGGEQAVYRIREIPDPQNPYLAHLDVNEDGIIDYTFTRNGPIPYRSPQGNTAFSPPLISMARFEQYQRDRSEGRTAENFSNVLTTRQYRVIKNDAPRPSAHDRQADSKTYVWLHPPFQDNPFFFDAVPCICGEVSGTSLIPANKIKTMFMSKKGQSP